MSFRVLRNGVSTSIARLIFPLRSCLAEDSLRIYPVLHSMPETLLGDVVSVAIFRIILLLNLLTPEIIRRPLLSIRPLFSSWWTRQCRVSGPA